MEVKHTMKECNGNEVPMKLKWLTLWTSVNISEIHFMPGKCHAQ